MTSVNTNSSATTALRTLQATNKALDTTQNRISTGLKIGEAKDNAAYWAISTTLKSDNKSLSTVKDALNLGAATVDTADQGLNKAREVLDEIKSKLTSATQDGLDRNVIQDEIQSLQDQLASISSSSIFSGENWLSIDSSATGYNAAKTVVASFSRDANNAVTIGTVDVDTTSIALYDSSTTSTGILDGSKALKDSAGVNLTVGGVDAAAVPTTSALVFGTPVVGTAVSNGGTATVAVGTLDLAAMKSGDKVNFNLTVGGSTATVSLATEGLTEANFAASLSSAIDAAVGNGQVTVAFDTTTKAVSLSTVAVGSAATIAVAAPAAANGDGVVTSSLGLNSTSSLPQFGTADVARVAAGTYAAATTAAGDKLDFKFQYDGEVYQASITYAGATGSEAAFQTLLNTALDTATRVSDGVALGANKATATITAGAISFATDATGEAKSIGVFDVEAETAAGVADATLDLGLVASTGVDYGEANGATISAGVFDTSGVKTGDTLTFAVNVNGSTTTNVSVSTLGLTNATSAADVALFQSNLQAAFNTVFTGGDAVTVAIDASTKAITLSTVAKGDDKFIALSSVVATDGDGLTTSTLGLTSASSTSGAPATPAVSAAVTGLAAFSGTQTLGAEDTISFDVSLNGGAATSITIDKARVNTALGVTTGTIGSAADYATVLNSALTAAGVAVTASEASGFVSLTKTSAAGVGTIAVSNVSSSAGADTISVDTIDISDDALTAAGVTSAADRKKVLSAYITVVNDAINSITTAAAKLGSVSSRIELQNSFVDTLMDTIDEGVGNLIDADLSEESTRLQALQTKQQLGVQALSIANSSTQNILRLFQ